MGNYDLQGVNRKPHRKRNGLKKGKKSTSLCPNMLAIAIVILAFRGCGSLLFEQMEDDLRLRSLDFGE